MISHSHDALTHSHEGGDKLHWHKQETLPDRMQVIEAKLEELRKRQDDVQGLIERLMILAAQNPFGRKMLERLGKDSVTR